jgi:adenylate kinase family enzyme
MKSMVIFISGNINSGKSTVSKLLVSQIPNTAIIEIDSIRQFLPWMNVLDTVPYNIENTVSVIRNFLNHGLNVIVAYPLSQNTYDFFVKELENTDSELLFFTLNPSIEKLIVNRGNRELDDRDLSGIHRLKNTQLFNNEISHLVDNSKETPSQTVNYILKMIDSHRSSK